MPYKDPEHQRLPNGRCRERNRLHYREYMRNWKRKERGVDYLTDFEIEAHFRGVTPRELVAEIMRTIARDDLFSAILDR